MDRYLLNDILKERSYIEWRDKIDEVNKEYHDKIYYDEPGEIYGECLRCRISNMFLWNWRSNDNINQRLYHNYCANYGYKWRYSNVNLPKNY